MNDECEHYFQILKMVLLSYPETHLKRCDKCGYTERSIDFKTWDYYGYSDQSGRPAKRVGS
jgi:hypothetical protein